MGCVEPGWRIIRGGHLSPEYPVAPALERLRHRLLRRLRFFSRREGADPFHQIEAQPHTVLVRLARREFPSRFVLRETVFGGVGGLSDVERRQRTRLTHAGA